MKEVPRFQNRIIGLNPIWLTENKKIDKNLTAKLVKI